MCQSNAFSSSGKRTVVKLEIKSLTPLNRFIAQRTADCVFITFSIHKNTQATHAKNVGMTIYRSREHLVEGRKTTLKPSKTGYDKLVRPSSNMNCEFTFSIHKTVKYQRLIVCVNNGGKPFEKSIDS